MTDKPLPPLPEKVEEAFARLHQETCDKQDVCLDWVHEALNGLRRAILVALLRARATEQDRLRRNQVWPPPNDVQDLLQMTADELRAQADALEKNDAN